VEEIVDEHRGVEGHAPVAQAVVAGLLVLSACRGMPCLDESDLFPIPELKIMNGRRRVAGETTKVPLP
jgi:hypothetical protein